MTFGTSIAIALLSFVNVFVVARSLGPTGRGEVAFLMTAAYLTSQISTMGVPQAVVNRAASQPHEAGALAGASLRFSAVLGGIAAATMFVALTAFTGLAAGTSPSLQIMALCVVPVMALAAHLQQLVLAHYHFRTNNLIGLVTPVTTVVVNGALAVLGQLTVGTALAAWVLGQTVAAVLFAWHTHYKISRFDRPPPGMARELVSFGARAHPGAVMTLGNYRLDQWILGAIGGAKELGIYTVAVAWAEALFFLPTALMLVQRADMVRASHEGAGVYATRTFRLTVVATGAMGLVMMIAAPFLVTTIFGAQFSNAVSELRVLILGTVGVIALKLFGTALTARGRPLRETLGVGVSFVSMVALDLLLIPPHGGMGAAIASSIAYSVGGLAVAGVFIWTLSAKASWLLPRPADARELVGLAGRLLRLRRSAGVA
ncbi:MAG TPA: oligosaccharide flippase family protein [Solirubrobacterales bacterium]|nr:oligosaccharide flippase family protein [Solirubrobacterales bacterium]